MLNFGPMCRYSHPLDAIDSILDLWFGSIGIHSSTLTQLATFMAMVVTRRIHTLVYLISTTMNLIWNLMIPSLNKWLPLVNIFSPLICCVALQLSLVL